jgi:cobalt/nickel transport system permease protein
VCFSVTNGYIFITTSAFIFKVVSLHIPDGYLGPLTYIPLFIIMIPIWLYAGYRVQKDLKSRQVPYLALAAAFSFVIMMFNVPIPDGSSGHAVGSALVAIVLGPWAAIVSTSVALVIQCFIFGDGGVTTLGANCFNMAVVIPISAYAVYKLISGKSPITSNRRLVACAIAGWFGLTFAAGIAGTEMGLQTILYPAVNGRFPYMPYGLNVTVPAMLFGHAFFFSIVEAAVTVLAFAYISRYNPSIIWDYKPKKKNKAADVVVSNTL